MSDRIRLTAARLLNAQRESRNEIERKPGDIVFIAGDNFDKVPASERMYRNYLIDPYGDRGQLITANRWNDDNVDARSKLNRQMEEENVTFKVIEPNKYNKEHDTKLVLLGEKGVRRTKKGNKMIKNVINYGDEESEKMVSLVLNPRKITNGQMLRRAVEQGVREVLQRLRKDAIGQHHIAFSFGHLSNAYKQFNTKTIMRPDQSNDLKGLVEEVLNKIKFYADGLYDKQFRETFDIGETFINFTLIPSTRKLGRGVSEFLPTNLSKLFEKVAWNPEGEYGYCLYDCINEFIKRYHNEFRAHITLAHDVPLARPDEVREIYELQKNIENENYILSQLAEILNFNIAVFRADQGFEVDQPCGLFYYAKSPIKRSEFETVTTKNGIYEVLRPVDHNDMTIFLIRYEDKSIAHYMLSTKVILLDRAFDKNGKLYKSRKIVKERVDMIPCEKCCGYRLPNEEEKIKFNLVDHVCSKATGCYKIIKMKHTGNNVKHYDDGSHHCRYKNHKCKCRRCGAAFEDDETLDSHACKSSTKKLKKKYSMDDIDKMLVTYDVETFTDQKEEDLIISNIETGGNSILSNISINFDDAFDTYGRVLDLPEVVLPPIEDLKYHKLKSLLKPTVEEQVQLYKLQKYIDRQRQVYRCSFLFINEIVSIIQSNPDYKSGKDVIKILPSEFYFISHYGSKFDNVLIFFQILSNNRVLLKHKVDISVIRDGSTIKDLTLTIPIPTRKIKVHFRDSYAFIPHKLRDLPKLLDFPEQKGDFDHEKNTIEQFDQNKRELSRYCKQDCVVLHQACIKLIEYFPIILGKQKRKGMKYYFIFDAISLSGLAQAVLMNVSKSKHNVCWQDHGKDQHRANSIRIQSELQKLGYDVVVSCCDIDGCEFCKDTTELINHHYKNYVIWSNKIDANNDRILITTPLDLSTLSKSDKYLIPECLCSTLTLTSYPIKPIRDSLYGGQTNPYQHHVKGEIFGLDINSSYADIVASNRLLPIGKDVLNMNPTLQDITRKEGTFSVDILPPRQLFNPILPLFPDETSSRSYYCLCTQCALEQNHERCYHTDEERMFRNYLIPSFVLRKAIQLGYKVIKLNYLYENTNWIPAKQYFGDTVNKLNVIKTLGRWSTTEQDHPELVDVAERNPHLLNNKAYLSFAKLLLSSIWGSFSQKDRPYDNRILQYHEIFPILCSGKYKLVEVLEKDDICLCQFEKLVLENPKNTNYHMSAYITAYARDKLNEMIELVGPDAMIYCDTDSVYFDRKKVADWDLIQKQISTRLGGWKIEADNVEEISVMAAKTLSLRFSDGRTLVKCKGATFDKDSVNNDWSPALLERFIRAKLFTGEDVGCLSVPQRVKTLRRDLKVRFVTANIEINRVELKRIPFDDENITTLPYGYC